MKTGGGNAQREKKRQKKQPRGRGSRVRGKDRRGKEGNGGFAKFSFVSYLNLPSSFVGPLYPTYPGLDPARRALINAPANNVFSPGKANPRPPPHRLRPGAQTYAELKTHLASYGELLQRALSSASVNCFSKGIPFRANPRMSWDKGAVGRLQDS